MTTLLQPRLPTNLGERVMVKLKLAKFQGPVIPERRHEPAQIVPEVPPLNLYNLFASGMADAIKPEYADRRFFVYAEECDADRLEVSP